MGDWDIWSRLFIFFYQYYMYRFLFDTYYGLYFFGLLFQFFVLFGVLVFGVG